ncbi:MAG: elongation factor G [Clostridia bacterium]|nr:elongation factor G [Clostridia bacterium]
MQMYSTKMLRNVCLLGHSGSGKTSLAEAMLFLTHAIDRLGKIPDGNTVCDYDPEEVKRGFSLSASVVPLEYRDVKINILDTPGYFDFEGEMRQCVRVADSAVIVVDGKNGPEVGTDLAWEYATEAGIPKTFFINRFDDGEARFKKAYDKLVERYGNKLCPILIPCIDGDKVIGFLYLMDMQVYTFDSKSGEVVSTPIPEQFMAVAEEYREKLVEAAATTSEDLMEKYFGGEEISQEEIEEAVHEGIIHNEIIPVFCGAAMKLWGVKSLLNTIVASFPRPTAKKEEKILADGAEATMPIDRESTETSLFVFKTIADPFVGKMSFFRVMEGTLAKDTVLHNTATGADEKFGRLLVPYGKKQVEADGLACGDIGVITKLSNTNTNDTLTTRGKAFSYAPIVFPNAYYGRSVVAAKGEEDKLSTGIARLLSEDLSIRFVNDASTRQLVLYGLGDIHLDVVAAKLKSRFNLSVTMGDLKFPYRETIKKKVDAEGKHKKQSGGSGQYGHVKITFSPAEGEGLSFSESVFGGEVPKNFFPAVEKGLLESMQQGVLAGYPMVGLAANLTGGSYHDVDSNEISFKLAAILAYKDGIPKAQPVLLEPVGELRVTVPDDYVGDIMGDVNKRRGRVLGIEACEGKSGYQTVMAEIPQPEMADYVITLRAATQGRGRFDYEFVRYEEVPANVAQKIIAAANAE